MRPRLVICSGASLLLIFVVIAESFTNASALERSASESCVSELVGNRGLQPAAQATLGEVEQNRKNALKKRRIAA
jgi:hypothetical protein